MDLNSSASRLFQVLFLLCILTNSAFANPSVPHLFSDHMVFERNVPIPVWGSADPGENIRVTLGDATRETVAGSDRRWSLALPGMPAGGPFLLEIRGKRTLEIKDVMIGEVWVASGQSNMTYALANAATAARTLPKANDPGLRFFTVPKRVSLTPQPDTLPAAWEICSTDTAKKFSAVAYFFARDLRDELHVPVGVILSAWPGTAGEEWTPPPPLYREPMLQPIVARWEARTAAEKSLAAGGGRFSLEFDRFELLPAAPGGSPVRFSKFDSGSSEVSTGGTWEYSWQEAPDSRFSLVAPGSAGKGYAAKISGSFTGASDSRWEVRFHSDGATEDLSAFSGVRFQVRGDGSFFFQTLQPNITDWDNYSSKLQQVTPEWRPVTVWFKDLRQDGWGVEHDLTLDRLSGFSLWILPKRGFLPRPPSGLYEGMIAPLVRYPIRGAIWYQGEGNTRRAFQYRTLLAALIQGWRAAWREPDFPFLVVQLPNQGHSEEFADSWWAELREAQLVTAETLQDTGLAVTIDVGEAANLHPPRKEEIGDRLALWALANTYGEKREYSGPLYESMRVEGNSIRLRFRHVGKGLELRGDSPTAFIVAGDDKKFHRAEARVDGDTIVVSSPEVASPVAVRYAWADSPPSTLFNKDGLPASPFRTDDWPGITVANR
jgi:sialate O-acetylesterase